MKTKKAKWIFGILAAGMAGVMADALFFEKYFFEVKSFNIGNKDSHRKLKLVLLTDLHFRATLWPYYRRLAEKVNCIRPDLILISGDSLDSSGELRPLNKFFALLHPGIQKVAIPGNHDHKAGESLTDLKKVYQQHNCDLLLNTSKVYNLQGERIVITGLDDFIEGESNFSKAVKDLSREDHHFLLVHSPLQQEPVLEKLRELNRVRRKEEQLNIRYIFAGHNHGGQIRLPGFVPVLPVRSGSYVNGWYNKQAPYLYVSKGFGTSTVPFRFGARSEVSVFYYGI